MHNAAMIFRLGRLLEKRVPPGNQFILIVVEPAPQLPGGFNSSHISTLQKSGTVRVLEATRDAIVQGGN